jgi:DNA polymerase III subunit epsilon
MRQVVLDTETTGLAVEKGHRVVEIGCIELVERRPTGRSFQRYLNPQRPMDAGASEVTGLTDEFLADKPLFADVAEAFLAFIEGAELIIHNAAFDVGFLDGELARIGWPRRLREMCPVIDSLELARERFPGQRNSLDALCKRLGVDNQHRALHGALLDAELLADVYLAMTAGQGALLFASLDAEPGPRAAVATAAEPAELPQRPLRVLRANAAERAAHAARLAALAKGGKCLWPAAGEGFSVPSAVA